MSWLTYLTPWDTLWWLIALFAVVAAIYIRGLLRLRGRVNPFAALGFLLGLALMYAVMETHFDYYAQYMFFMHRLQHLVLHHLGPFLIAISAPSAVLVAGSPRWLRRVGGKVAASPVTRISYHTVQQPVIAGLIFVGLIAFWLWPAVHFDAMLGYVEYWTMNLSMAVDGLLFWWFMMDPRRPGSTPVTRGIGVRIVVLWLVMIPQIIIGATIALSRGPIYDVYEVCGRAWPISPVLDQHLGGLITWIPAAMMSAVAMLVLLRYSFRHQNEQAQSSQSGEAS